MGARRFAADTLVMESLLFVLEHYGLKLLMLRPREDEISLLMASRHEQTASYAKKCMSFEKGDISWTKVKGAFNGNALDLARRAASGIS